MFWKLYRLNFVLALTLAIPGVALGGESDHGGDSGSGDGGILGRPNPAGTAKDKPDGFTCCGGVGIPFDFLNDYFPVTTQIVLLSGTGYFPGSNTLDNVISFGATFDLGADQIGLPPDTLDTMSPPNDCRGCTGTETVWNVVQPPGSPEGTAEGTSGPSGGEAPAYDFIENIEKSVKMNGLEPGAHNWASALILNASK